MRKITSLVILVLASFTTQAEVWLDAGIKGGFAPGVFTNPHILDSKTQALGFPTGYLYGGKFGINFGLTHSITVDAIISSSSMTLNEQSSNNFRKTTISSFDLPVMYRVNQENGGYAEIGPQWSFTQSATLSTQGGSTDVKDRFNSQNMGIAFGFGQYVGGSDAIGINIGFRGAYMFKDIVSTGAQTATLDPVYQPVGTEDVANYSYSESGRLYLGLVVELNLNIGYFTNGPACSKRTRFRLF